MVVCTSLERGSMLASTMDMGIVGDERICIGVMMMALVCRQIEDKEFLKSSVSYN